MELDGTYIDLLCCVSFNFAELEVELKEPKDMYLGKGLFLNRGIGKSFDTLLQCTHRCGQLSYSYWKNHTINCNKFARLIMSTSGKFSTYNLVDISVREMIQFKGTIFRMRVDDRHMGGYAAYFTDTMQNNCRLNYSVLLKEYPGWAKKIMPLWQFKQTHSLIHPGVGASEIEHKCNQL